MYVMSNTLAALCALEAEQEYEEVLKARNAFVH